MRSTKLHLGALLAAALTALPAAAAPPLSANNWLSGGPAPAPPVSAWRPGDVTPREATRRAPRRPAGLPQGVAADVRVPAVGVTRLEGPDADRSGTLPADAAGLPRDLWAGTTAAQIGAALAASRPRLPAGQHLLRRILLAQLDPPQRASRAEEGALFLARVDRLIAMGAIDAARALLDAAGPGDDARLARRFDTALLMGEETRACEAMAARPGAAPDLAARLFCLARAGDWPAAAMGLRGATAMGLIEPGQAARLEAFLDDTGTDAGTAPPLPDPVTPLDFRLLTAIGQPLATADLPVAYAWADLSPEGGWKARLEAAERLARQGSLPASRLRDIYMEERPAASGGVWERAGAIQTLDRALTAADPDAVAQALPAAVAAMGHAGLTEPLAAMAATAAAALKPGGEADRLARDLMLYDSHILAPASLAALPPDDPAARWLLAVATGQPLPEAGAPADGLGPALAAALSGPAPAPPGGSRGLALLGAISDADAGLDGDGARAARGIATLRGLGAETTARAAALQLLLGPALGAARM